jgi:hypothetical protein
VGGAERAPHDLENLLIGHSVPTGTSPFRKIAETFSLADPQPPGANGPKPGIDDGVQHAALRYGMSYRDPGADHYEQQYRSRVLANHQRRAKSLGFVLQAIPEDANPAVS